MSPCSWLRQLMGGLGRVANIINMPGEGLEGHNESGGLKPQDSLKWKSGPRFEVSVVQSNQDAINAFVCPSRSSYHGKQRE
jgi:hypothetical protein